MASSPWKLLGTCVPTAGEKGKGITHSNGGPKKRLYGSQVLGIVIPTGPRENNIGKINEHLYVLVGLSWKSKN